MESYILSIDQGTTSSRAILLDREMNIIGVGQKEFEQIFPSPGWVEHKPEAIWESVSYSIEKALEDAGVSGSDVAGIGITNQRETLVLWDRVSGEAVHNAIVWQCRRSAQICTRLKQQGLEAKFTERTGLLLDPYFSGTKLTWLFENVDGLRQRAAAGELKAGTIDSFLVDRLTDGEVHVTDVSNASRTLLFNIHKLQWDEDLAADLGVPVSILPKVAGCSEIYGKTKGLSCLPDGIPVCGIAGDQQAALFGQACFKPGEAKCTYGTGAFLLMNTGEKAVPSKNRLLTTVAWQIDGKTTYALEGSAFIAGAAVQWLRDGLNMIKDSSEIEALAATVDSAEGVVLVPALAGLGAPHWRSEARGLISGLTRGTTKAHIARAALDGIALQNFEILSAMQSDSGEEMTTLKVDGGASANNLMMQFQADILNCELVRPEILETTAIGAAFLAGLAVGVWKDLDDIRGSWKENRRFLPLMDAQTRAEHLQSWEIAVNKA